MDIIVLIGLIVVIAVVCSLLDIPEKFQKLLYIICAVLLIGVILSFFGIMPNHVQLR